MTSSFIFLEQKKLEYWTARQVLISNLLRLGIKATVNESEIGKKSSK